MSRRALATFRVNGWPASPPVRRHRHLDSERGQFLVCPASSIRRLLEIFFTWHNRKQQQQQQQQQLHRHDASTLSLSLPLSYSSHSPLEMVAPVRANELPASKVISGLLKHCCRRRHHQGRCLRKTRPISSINRTSRGCHTGSITEQAKHSIARSSVSGGVGPRTVKGFGSGGGSVMLPHTLPPTTPPALLSWFQPFAAICP